MMKRDGIGDGVVEIDFLQPLWICIHEPARVLPKLIQKDGNDDLLLPITEARPAFFQMVRLLNVEV